MADALMLHSPPHIREVNSLAAAIAAGEIYQMYDGRAGVLLGNAAGAAADARSFATDGIFRVTKSTGHVITPGDEVWWDHSANAAISKPAQAGDRDFCLGILSQVDDAATGDVLCNVALNQESKFKASLQKGGWEHIPVLTAGTPVSKMIGNSLYSAFSATAEAQKLDALSSISFGLESNWIVDGILEVVTNADADVADLNVGVANATHASDADSITEAAFIHLDMGGSLNILAESDDGTTEVAATDTTLDWAVGTPFRFVLDGRDTSDVQMYVNGALVLGGTTFDISAATGPLRLLYHLEKSANDSPGIVLLHEFRVRCMQQ